MKNKFDDFLKLHHQPELLLIGNVWNAQSAKVFEQQGFKAVATSSAAVAETLGVSDGQGMTLDDYLVVIKHIAASTTLPVSVDFEAGYGKTPEAIAASIGRLSALGVVGINIEDSVVVDGKRSIVDASTFAKKLERIVKLLDDAQVKMFINVRSDSFLLGLPNALNDALLRADAYQNTGAHGLFFPCIKDIADIAQVTGRSKLPVNVMCIPGLPDFKSLQQAGVKRISMGPFLNMNVYQYMKTALERINTEGNFNSLFA